MIELTAEQSQAIASGENPPVVVDPTTQTTYVLVRKDVYEQLAYDDSPWTDEERDMLRAEALDALGWEGMDRYQEEP